MTYRGVMFKDHVSVTRQMDGGKETALAAARSQAVRNHSPDGFCWGYGGSGPAQLALAILLDYTDDIALSEHLYHEFKRQFVAKWGTSWTLTGSDIERFLYANQNHQA